MAKDKDKPKHHKQTKKGDAKSKAEIMRELREKRKTAGKVDYRRSVKPKTAKELDKVLSEIEPTALPKKLLVKS